MDSLYKMELKPEGMEKLEIESSKDDVLQIIIFDLGDIAKVIVVSALGWSCFSLPILAAIAVSRRQICLV